MIKVRSNVFETNSSSSHSLTMGTADLAPQPFPAAALREGVITVDLDEYGWEYRRLYAAENKISYLLTQLGPRACYDASLDSLEALCKQDERAAQLCRVVKEHTGCEIQLGCHHGYIDHESVGVGTEVFGSDETLKQFLFSEDSFIQTGNDNSSAPWWMPTDRGPELTYAPAIHEVPADYVPLKLKMGDTNRGYLLTAKGACLGEGFNKARLKEVLEQGIVTWVQVSHEGYHNPYTHQTVQSDWAARLTERGARLAFKLAPGFNGACEHKNGKGYEVKATLTVAVPPALAKALTALPKTPQLTIELAQAKERVKLLNAALKRAKKESKSDPVSEYLIKAVAEATASLETLKAQASAKGVL